MGTVIAIIVIVAVVLIGFAVYSAMRKRQSEGLRTQFGSEYDRAVDQYGDARSAEPILKERVERVKALQVIPLSYKDRERYEAEWTEVQAQFVDDPAAAVAEADRLVGRVMQQRRYPVGDFEQRAADVSVDHPDVVENYRAAHEIAQRQENDEANTEDLRQAMVHYRALFQELLRPDTADVLA